MYIEGLSFHASTIGVGHITNNDGFIRVDKPPNDRGKCINCNLTGYQEDDPWCNGLSQQKPIVQNVVCDHVGNVSALIRRHLITLKIPEACAMFQLQKHFR